jgi:DNA-binding response OmpR family regulator
MNNTILIVDDNPTIRERLSVRLRANGYAVLFAEDANSASAAVITERPDLVLLDLGLPAEDGFAVVEHMHKSYRLATIPVIVLTGRKLAGDKNRAMQAGAAAFFQKPLDDGILLSAIRKALDVARSELPLDEN